VTILRARLDIQSVYLSKRIPQGRFGRMGVLGVWAFSVYGRFASAVKRSTGLSKQENPTGAFWVYGRFGCAAILRVRLHVRPVGEKRPRPPSVLGQAKCAPRLWNVELWHKKMWKGKGKEEWERSR